MSLTLRDPSTCRYEQISLGEVMLRLDPGEGRIRTARHFSAWEGGGEYNTARALRKCFGLRSAICTALVDNEVGHLIEDLIMQGGVDTDFIKWRENDGSGRTVRNGINFTERGFGIRGALGNPDRGHTAASQLKTGDFDWDHIFGKLGVRWFHTGGIFPALSESTAQLTIDAVTAAKKHGTIVSYDLNYRPSLWKAAGGLAKAREVNHAIATHVDVMIGVEAEGLIPEADQIETAVFERLIEKTLQESPHLKVVATTMRRVITASRNDWGGLCWHNGRFYESRKYPELEILDRIGGGDGFASGLIYGFLSKNDPQAAVDYGAAHGAHASTTPGDTSMATRQELEKLIKGVGSSVVR